MRLQVIIIALITASFFSGCGNKITNPTQLTPVDISVTPLDNEEAELAALHLSGELVAPVGLYNKVKQELELIRSSWKDSIIFVNLEFVPFYKASALLMAADTIVFDSMLAGTYIAWDSLNSYYRLKQFKEIFTFNDKVYFQLNFTGRLNSFVLNRAYKDLPDLLGVGWITNRTGDYPLLVPFKTGNRIKYFFRHGYGDCPSGCLNSDVFYFTVERGQAIYHGSYSYEFPLVQPIPTWLDTFEMAFNKYHEVY